MSQSTTPIAFTVKSRAEDRPVQLKLKSSAVGSTDVDRWIKCIATAGNVRGIAITATHLAREVARLHGLTGEPAKSLAEASIGALMLSAYCKAGERVNLNIQGSGFVKQALVDAYPDGSLRGYIVVREAGPDLERFESKDAGPWGTGFLSVLRTKLENQMQPYIGTVPLVTGHLAKDLTFYWVQSEQVPSSVGIAVTLDQKGEIESAGGFLIQALPGASAAEISAIESHIATLSDLARQIAENHSPIQLLSHIFQSTAFMVLQEQNLDYVCQCSWDRMMRALTLIGTEELNSILKDPGYAEVYCDFCTKQYRVDSKVIQDLLDGAKA
ncbi:MAG: Hsp33 family molecular chaperone HslO [Bdellovibrionales bacterium]|nr:Hsp33 family molecular chaperone HslO [Bdellovibrionales bacterium]